MAGSHKHKYSWILKYEPDHFGRKGMAQPGRAAKPKTVNIGYLNQYAEKQQIKEIDLSKLGLEKVLGGGKIDKALTIKATYFTEKAKQKIEAAGGKAIQPKTVTA